MLNKTPESGGFQLGARVLLHRSGTIGTMTEREPRQPQPPGDPSGIEEPHDVLAADEFGIGTRDERMPPDPSGIQQPHDVLELSPANRIEITVDRSLCIGSGDCVDTAPDVFQLDDEDKAVVVDPDGAPLDDVLTAAGNCPVSAIFVVGESGDLYP